MPKVKHTHAPATENPGAFHNDSPVPPRGYAVAPRSIIRDSSLSLGAFRLYVLLDDRQGTNPHVHVRQTVLAADLGFDERTVREWTQELVAAGLLTTKRTRAVTRYTVHNPERLTHDRKPDSGRDRNSASGRDRNSASGAVSKKSFSKNSSKQASTSADEHRATEHAAAAPVPLRDEHDIALEGLADPLTVDAFLSGTPLHRRPTSSTTIARLLYEALQRMPLDSLLARIAADITNPEARAGLTVDALRRWRSLPVVAVKSAATRAPWCGDCDAPETRLVALEDGRVAPCHSCHPKHVSVAPVALPVAVTA
jgi:hypothetical protein